MDDLALVDVVDDDGSSAEECAIAAEMALVNLAALLATQPGGGLPASRLQDLKLALERTLALITRPPPPDAAGGGGSARARMGLTAARNNRLMQRRPSLTPQDVEEGPASMANLGRRMSLSSEAKLQGSLG